MRFILVGLLNLTLAGIALGQAVGDVESIGFGRAYRPNAWTPMVVRLTPTTSSPFRGKIQVIQEDLDKDRVLFTRTVDLRGNAEGGAEKTQRYWMYFIPQPSLHEAATTSDLNKYKLQVFLCTEGGKQLVQLPVKDAITDLDYQGPSVSKPHSSKLVLYICDQSKPIFSPYTADAGRKEDVEAVQIPINNVRALLPENVLGYESVDAIVWLDADPTLLTAEQRAALEEWIRRGGKFIVSQTGRPNLWDVVRREFATLLPVAVRGIDQAADFTALRRIVAEGALHSMLPVDKRPTWPNLKAPYPIARATAKPGATVAEIFDSTRSKVDGGNLDVTPWLVRGSYGTGSVTWVAQDLGDVSVIGEGRRSDEDEAYKWCYVWDRVFDWPNDSQAGPAAGPEKTANRVNAYKDRYPENAGTYRLGETFSKAMDFSDKGVGYLGLAVVFFIVYWIAAGPASYLYLAARKKAGYSWFVFAGAAIVGTGLTVIIVKLVLPSAPELHHATFIRTAPDEPAVAYSEVGLYIPRDGEQSVSLQNTLPGDGSYLTAFPDITATGGGFSDHVDYEVNVTDPRTVGFRYRSTLKKLQARWVGRTETGIVGSARLGPNLTIFGSITNKTGRDLHHVYVAFNYPSESLQNRGDWILYIPEIKKDDGPLDLGSTFSKSSFFNRNAGRYPGGDYVIRGKLSPPGPQRPDTWDLYWYSSVRADTANGADSRDFPMLSLYDRLPVWGVTNEGNGEMIRYDLRRAWLRNFDAAGALSAGKLVVLATTDAGPIPIPMEVGGRKLEGTGITYFQSILPLDGSALAPQPSTRPTTAPTTTATTAPVVSASKGAE